MADRKKNINQMISCAAFLLLAGSCVISAKAAETAPENPYGPTANVWLSVAQIPTEARVSVTVPLSYGFAVIGSVDAADTGAVSVENGNLMLSNVKVVVNRPSEQLPDGAGQADFSIVTEGAAAMIIKNYSTDVRDENMGTDNPVREGLPVEVEPYVLAVDDKGHHWKPSAVPPAAIADDFKKFQMSIDGKPFSKEATIGSGTDKKKIIKLEQKLNLDAPPDVETNGYTSAGTANIPSEKYLDITLKVGGLQNQYKQVEHSVKVGEIRWKIIPGTLK